MYLPEFGAEKKKKRGPGTERMDVFLGTYLPMPALDPSAVFVTVVVWFIFVGPFSPPHCFLAGARGTTFGGRRRRRRLVVG